MAAHVILKMHKSIFKRDFLSFFLFSFFIFKKMKIASLNVSNITQQEGKYFRILLCESCILLSVLNSDTFSDEDTCGFRGYYIRGFPRQSPEFKADYYLAKSIRSFLLYTLCRKSRKILEELFFISGDINVSLQIFN